MSQLLKYVLKIADIYVVQTACFLLCCLMYRVNVSIAKICVKNIADIFVVQTACFLLCCLMYRVNMSRLQNMRYKK